MDPAPARLASLTRYLHAVGPAEPDAVLLARFARTADEAAFAELVRRHGPTVLGVCRRLLRDGHAADDAFQATFLLLAKKAHSLLRPERLSAWLYGVAYRTAVKLRGRLARRQTREHPFDETAFIPAEPADVGVDLDAAIQQLPSKYREPVVLCYLHGLTNAEAAAALGCPTNTVATRLARARERLRGRLVKEGLTVGVSAALLAATARNAAALMQGAGPASEIVTLMEGVRTAMMWDRAKIVIAAAAILTLTGLGAGRFAYRAGADEPRPTPSQPTATPPTGPSPAIAPADLKLPANVIPPTELTVPKAVTKNFVVTGASQAVCEKVATAAEFERRELAKMWLGKELPDWKKPCPIKLTIGRDGASAATTFQFEKAFEIGGMQLQGTEAHILDNLLPHEVTHTILADTFRKPVPRWFDEGAAILAEGDAERARMDGMCRQLLKQGSALRLSALFPLTDYPNNSSVVFAQGHSVVQFLITNFDRVERSRNVKKFNDPGNLMSVVRQAAVTFVRQGMASGWDAAASEVYGYHTINELEQEWLNSLRRTTSVEPATASRPEPPRIDNTRPTEPVAPPTTEPPPPAADPTPPTPTSPVVPAIDQQQPVQPPSIVPPAAMPGNHLSVVQVWMEKDGMVVCRFAKRTVYEPITTYRQANGAAQPVTTFTRRSVQEERGYRAEQIVIVGTDGKPIADADLAKRLAKETPALFVTDTTIDPELLSLLKEGTLIVRLKQQHLPPAPPLSPSPR